MRTSDYIVVSLARLLRDKENAFHGLASIFPMIAIQLAMKVHNRNLVYLNITGGVNVKSPVLTTSTDGANLYEGTQSRFTLADIFDLSSRGKLDVAFLSCSQVDLWGNINNSVIGSFNKPKVRLPGGAGSAVLLPNAKNAIIWKSKHDRRSFVEKVDFITASGNVKFVVTPLCIFKLMYGKLVCYELYPGISKEEVINNTAFEVDFSHLIEFVDISDEELSALNIVDPDFLRDFEL